MGHIINNPQDIRSFRNKVLLSGLRLEILGLKHSRTSTYSLIKKEFGFKGSKQQVYDQLKAII
jgi:hypothetical protein